MLLPTKSEDHQILRVDDFYLKMSVTTRISGSEAGQRAPNTLDSLVGRSFVLCIANHRLIHHAETIDDVLSKITCYS
jgi:hypothetical protein